MSILDATTVRLNLRQALAVQHALRLRIEGIEQLGEQNFEPEYVADQREAQETVTFAIQKVKSKI